MRCLVTSLSSLALACCAAPEERVEAPPSVSPPAPEREASPSGRAAQLAETLLLAERAEAHGDRETLAYMALRLARLAPVAETPGDEAALARWLDALPENDEPMRGRALGPAFRSGMLAPGTSARIEQTFLGGRVAQIVLRVAEGSVLHLEVSDHAQRKVCEDSDDPIQCRWTPLYTQRHQVEISNEGREKARFYIVFD